MYETSCFVLVYSGLEVKVLSVSVARSITEKLQDFAFKLDVICILTTCHLSKKDSMRISAAVPGLIFRFLTRFSRFPLLALTDEFLVKICEQRENMGVQCPNTKVPTPSESHDLLRAIGY